MAERRTAQSVAPFQGSDLRLDYALGGGFFEDADLGTERRGSARDIAISAGLDNLTQAIANRLKTRQGELAALGHPTYGSRHHELIGEPNVERTRNLIKLYVLQALRDEPRIERVLRATVRAEHDPPRETVRIELDVRVLGRAEPLNLVVPFARSVCMTYAAEPYVQFVDDLLTALTGGVVRDEFQFLAENAPFRLHSGTPIPSTVRITGLSGAAYRRFQSGKDYRLEPDFSLTWLTTADARVPDDGAFFYANYEVVGTFDTNPPLSDRNPGSVTRLLAESFAREYAVLSRQLDGIYNASFVETATGRDLEQIGVLLGVERRTATFAIGSVVFFRSTPAPADIFIPVGTRVSTSTPPPAQFETQLETTLLRGSLSVEVPIQALVAGGPGVVTAQAITVLNRPILGIDGASNPRATGFQSANETDTQLRERIRRALEGAGQATPGALIAALTTIPGVREKDIQILEDPVSRPGVIQVNVALPELPSGQEADMLTQLAEQAVALIEAARPVGVRIIHNIDAPKPLGLSEAGPGVQPDEGGDPATAASPPTGSLSLPIDVNVFLTPTTRSLTEAERTALIAAGEQIVRAFVDAAGIGETLVFNRLVGQLMDLEGVLDVALEMFPQNAPDAPKRKNILPIDPALRPVAGRVDVQLQGSLIALDVAIGVTRKGAGLVTDPAQLSATIASDVTAVLNLRLRTGALAQLTVDALKGLVGTADTYTLNSLDYFVEYQDAGVRIRQKNPSITPAESDQFWVRRVTVDVH